jgi:hypothetical protein
LAAFTGANLDCDVFTHYHGATLGIREEMLFACLHSVLKSLESTFIEEKNLFRKQKSNDVAD